MCTMHPDPAYRSCRVPQERVPSDDRYLECDGYVASPKSQMGSPDNVKYFGELVMRHLRSVDSRQRVLRWLGSLKHQELLVGVKVGTPAPRLTCISCFVVLLGSVHQNRRCGPFKSDALITLTCSMQVPLAKLGLTVADQLSNLLAELELTPFSADGRKTAPATAALWQQGHMLAVLYLDTVAAHEAAGLCRGLGSGAVTTG